MPIPAFMSVEGVTQGMITEGALSEESVGNLYQEGRDDQFMVQAFEHSIMIPRDSQSGQPSGTRIHKPLTVTKVFDKASPLLYQALVTGESLICRIEWYRTSSEGLNEHYFTHELEGAAIVDIKSIMPNCQDPNTAHFTHLEEVSFSYSTITWTHEVAGTEGTDDWRAGSAG
ncbi:MAG: Hcp family type VI secretion system effector [Gammaproteobacteria bacterium]|nr:Hcp family type VI secretion system effector [Gammaproteobacteria bacterium]